MKSIAVSEEVYSALGAAKDKVKSYKNRIADALLREQLHLPLERFEKVIVEDAKKAAATRAEQEKRKAEVEAAKH